MAKRDKRSVLMVISGIVLFFAIVTIVLMVFFLPREIQVSDNSSKTTSIMSLVCRSDYLPRSFFFDANAEKQQYIVRAAYQDNKLSSISFGYTGIFGSEKEADNVESKMHAKFNLYMYDYGLDPEKYNPNFRNLANEARVELFSSVDNMSDAFARVVLSEDSNTDIFTKNEYKDLSEIYEKVGYSCEYSE